MLVPSHILVQSQSRGFFFPGIIKNQLVIITLNDARKYLLHFRHIPSLPYNTGKGCTHHDETGKIDSLLLHVLPEFCRFLFCHIQSEIRGH